MIKRAPYDDEEDSTISRFTIAILGSALLGMTWGRSVPYDLFITTFTASGIAFLFYLYETKRDELLRKKYADASRQVAEMRLIDSQWCSQRANSDDRIPHLKLAKAESPGFRVHGRL